MVKQKVKQKKLVIITGITGKLGEAYLDYFREDYSSTCVGFSRKTPKKKHEEVIYLKSDLLDRETIRKSINKISFKEYSEVILIHPIGMFKFEHQTKPKKGLKIGDLDPEVYSSNVLTFKNMYDSIKSKLNKDHKDLSKVTITLCAFGSISDKYNIPYWNSYTRSKNILRRLIKKSIDSNKNLKIRGIFVNVSTTDTGNENKLRPSGEKTYWLSSKEIVDSSVPTILRSRRRWNEINIFKHNPDFDTTWYTNHENVLERWERQMKGGKR